MFKRVDHAAISVKDMATLIGIEDVQARIVHMKLGDSAVERFDYKLIGLI